MGCVMDTTLGYESKERSGYSTWVLGCGPSDRARMGPLPLKPDQFELLYLISGTEWYCSFERSCSALAILFSFDIILLQRVLEEDRCRRYLCGELPL